MQYPLQHAQMCDFKKCHKVPQYITTINCLHSVFVTIYQHFNWGKFVLFEIFTFILALPPFITISKNMKKKLKKKGFLWFFSQNKTLNLNLNNETRLKSLSK